MASYYDRLTADAERFVRAWQSSTNLAEVCKKIGCSYNAAFMRAARYREKGVELKVLTRAALLDYAAVDSAAREAIDGSDRGR